MRSRSRRRRFASRKSPRLGNRLLRNEPLEPRSMLSGGGIAALLATYRSPTGSPVVVSVASTVPTLTISGGGTVTGKTASLVVSGVNAEATPKPIFIWSVLTAPSGGTAKFSRQRHQRRADTTISFTKAGSYTVAVTVDGASAGRSAPRWPSSSRRRSRA